MRISYEKDTAVVDMAIKKMGDLNEIMGKLNCFTYFMPWNEKYHTQFDYYAALATRLTQFHLKDNQERLKKLEGK
jgi:hypothetical protein